MSSPFINFTDPTTSEGRKLWELACKSLKDEFDGSKAAYPVFKAQIRDKVRMCKWEQITTFLINGISYSLVDNADLIPMEIIKAAKDTRDTILLLGVRPAAEGIEEITQAQFDEAAKENLMAECMHACLTNSVKGDLAAHVANKQNSNATLNCGSVLLKIIQDKVRGKAVRQNMSNARNQLKNAKLKEFKWNITSFNEHLKSLITTLQNNQEPFLPTDVSNTLVVNYKQVKHEEFLTMLNILLNESNTRNVDPDYEELIIR